VIDETTLGSVSLHENTFRTVRAHLHRCRENDSSPSAPCVTREPATDTERTTSFSRCSHPSLPAKRIFPQPATKPTHQDEGELRVRPPRRSSSETSHHRWEREGPVVPLPATAYIFLFSAWSTTSM